MSEEGIFIGISALPLAVIMFFSALMTLLFFCILHLMFGGVFVPK